MQFLNPVTHDRYECLGTLKHPGTRNNKIKILIKKKEGTGACQVHNTLCSGFVPQDHVQCALVKD